MKNVVSRTAQALALSFFAWIASAQTAMAARAAQEDLVTAYLAIHEKLAGDSAKEVAALADGLAAAAPARWPSRERSRKSSRPSPLPQSVWMASTSTP